MTLADYWNLSLIHIFSRMTIVVRGDDKVLDQVNKQLDKLINVISVEDFGESNYIDRELVLIRAVSYTHLDVYKRQVMPILVIRSKYFAQISRFSSNGSSERSSMCEL